MTIMRRPLGIMTDPLLRSGKFQLDHALDLRRFLEMVQLVRLNPPGSGLHQEFGVVIPVVKEGIEGQAHIGPLLVDLGVADSNDFLFQACTHNQIFNDGGFSRTTTSIFPGRATDRRCIRTVPRPMPRKKWYRPEQERRHTWNPKTKPRMVSD